MLVLVLSTLLIVDTWGVIDAKMAVENAARQGVRAFVLAPSATDAPALARQAAGQAISASGRAPSKMVFSLQGSMIRCSTVEVRVAYPVELVPVRLGGGRGSEVLVGATHTEMVPPFRSGATGSAGAGCG